MQCQRKYNFQLSTPQVRAFHLNLQKNNSNVFVDEDPKYKASELNTHGPTVKGWQSTKNCEYPQELILKLEKRCSLHKIQFLAHQYLIRQYFKNNNYFS